jgi:hypothetical protein
LFLGDPANRPSMEVNEDMWLSNTESVLALAEQEYERIAKLITQYGGPSNARTV